jgi:hypothetical protein
MRWKLAIIGSLLMCIPEVGLCRHQAHRPINAVAIAQHAPPQVTDTINKAKPPAQKSPAKLHSVVDYSLATNIAALLSTLALTYLCCHPIGAFRRRGWDIKKADIFSSLSVQAKMLYLKTFGFTDVTDPTSAFDEMYDFRYGRYRLTAPLILLILITFPLMFLETSSGWGALIVANSHGTPSVALLASPFPPVFAVPNIALAAIAGAYAWVVASLFDGATRYNLPPQVVLGASLRLAIAIPLGYSIQSIAAPGIAPFFAFALGAFPLAEVQILLKHIATNKLGLETSADHQKDQVSALDGIDQPTADRLEEGDVLTIAQMAYCDPVQLSMRTNLSFNSIVDAQSQALAWIYVGDNLPQLAKIGFRGAIEIAHFYGGLSTESDLNGPANKLLQIASDRTGVPPDKCPAQTPALTRTPIPADGLRNAFREIAGDPYTCFLSEVWNSTGQNVGKPLPVSSN